LKYIVNKPVLEGRICRWLLLFQEFSFEVIFKLGRCNIGLDHLSRLESGESGRVGDDQLPDADLFWVETIRDYLEDIKFFVSIGACLKTHLATQKCHMVVREMEYQLITGQLYKLGQDSILRICVLDHETQDILWECHSGVAGGHVGGKATTQKVLQYGLWWATLFKDAKVYTRSCDVCQKWVSHHGEMNYRFNQFDLYMNLRNGKLTSLDQSTPRIIIQRIDTSSPQLTTLRVGLKQQRFKTVHPILLLGSFFRILSLDLDALRA
jgi:hypothetical protein